MYFVKLSFCIGMKSHNRVHLDFTKRLWILVGYSRMTVMCEFSLPNSVI